MKKSKFFGVGRLITGPGRQFIKWFIRKQLKKRYRWLRVECFTLIIAGPRSKCCNAMVWQAERGGKIRWFCSKCTNRLTDDFAPHPFAYSISEVDGILRKSMTEFKNKLLKLTPKSEQWQQTITEFVRDSVKAILLLY